MKTILPVLSSALLWALSAAFILHGTQSLPEVDGYYHLQISEIMMKHGIVLPDKFPYTTCSIWTDSFFDKDFLFHLYLIPFISVFGKLAGGKAAIIVASFLIAIAWAVLLRTAGVRKNIFPCMAFMLFGAAYVLPERLVFCRSFLLALVFLPLALTFIIRGLKAPLVIAAFLYTLSHAGSWQLLPVAVLFDAVRIAKTREKPAPLNLSSLWVLAGIAAGSVLNPYFPANITGTFIQDVLVLKARWFGTGGDILNQGVEYSPPALRRIFTAYLPLLAVFIFAAYDVFSKKRLKELQWHTAAMFALSAVYLALTMLSQRFVEYFAPAATVFACSYFSAFASPLSTAFRKAVFSILIAALAIFSVQKLHFQFHKDHLLYSGAAEWIRKSVEPGSVVFTGDWDDAPILFFSAPQYKYPVMLEPYFMYLHSPEKYRLWKKVTDGKSMNSALVIHEEFGSDTVFVPPDKPRLAHRLEEDPRAKLVFKGPYSEKVYSLNIPESDLKTYRAMESLLRR